MSDVLDRHSRMPRKYLATGEPQERSEDKGQFMPIPAERKEELIKSAIARITKGEDLDQIAADLQIGTSTLDRWLQALGEQYRVARRAWVDWKLSRTDEMMELAENPLELARWRDLGRRAEWLAERLDERYMEKREVTVKDDEPSDPEFIRQRISELEERLGIRTIEGQKEAG